MNVSRRWLEAFLNRPLDAHDMAERLAMLGAPVDAIEPLHGGLKEIVVGVVEEVRPHPNADRLRVCTVNDGTPERRNVVCGAPNVEAGGRYPFAPIGATLPGGLRIEKRKLRGEPSEGMLCSGRELGLSDDADGLLALTTDAPAGTALTEVLPVDDERLVVDVTPNRADLNGHKGVARELAASYGVPFRLPPIPGADAVDVPPSRRSAGPAAVGPIEVSIERPTGCARFLGAVIRGARVAPSPDWLRRRIESVGMRSISNVVDVTNYIMLELNQPLHAYDLATLRGSRIMARDAHQGEVLRTLDGQDRALTPGMTVIADGEGVIGVAGVMGGETTEISPTTTDLFLECAWFEPAGVRRTRRTLGLSTESSYRFERGADLHGASDAFRRALEMLLATAGGTLDGVPVDVWPEPSHPARIFLRQARLAQVLGVELPLHLVERALVAIGAPVVAKPEDGRLAVEPPGWRPDLVEEIDLIEEVARIHGYDQFPDALRPFRPGAQGESASELAASEVRRGLAALGLYEAVSLAMGPDLGQDQVAILNPLSADHSHLRRDLLPGLARAAELNWGHQVRDIRLFEVGTVFRPGQPGRAPEEEIRVAGLISGAREPAHWTASGKAPDADRWDLRGLFDAVVGLAYPSATVQVEGDGWVARRPDGAAVGLAGMVTADRPAWAAQLFGFEITLDAVQRTRARFHPFPTMPAVTRDIALVLPGGVTAEQVAVRLAEAGPLLESVQVVDEYRGAGVAVGRRSVAFRLSFRSAERTLRDKEVDAAVARALTALERELDVTLRTA
ncbi:MAG TPA: phenylalanine--tRNA ligase subunit beta [Gemmatimonadales bacterium]|nr:phenylalanine--tRNA ligase subunit beta [Gemmatimonadales bacterium]